MLIAGAAVEGAAVDRHGVVVTTAAENRHGRQQASL